MKNIQYIRESGDYEATLDGRLIGYYRNYQEAEVALDAQVYTELSKPLARVASTPEPIVRFTFGPGAHQVNDACLQDAYVQSLADADYQTARWQRALHSAFEHLIDETCVSFRGDGAYFWTPNSTEGGHYAVTPDTCQCKAFQSGQPCRHRAAAVILSRYGPDYIYIFRFGDEIRRGREAA